ncbi:MAG: 23S rRNA (uracil(1939)-C(5))-methyltransferase RlmD [Candidatus Binatia bacterium]|nr:MAG: 23S rRNA (uracil(1939)-C(5))-methyltransferase RlmD [Candidatus Binatia bacterium]
MEARAVALAGAPEGQAEELVPNAAFFRPRLDDELLDTRLRAVGQVSRVANVDEAEESSFLFRDVEVASQVRDDTAETPDRAPVGRQGGPADAFEDPAHPVEVRTTGPADSQVGTGHRAAFLVRDEGTQEQALEPRSRPGQTGARVATRIESLSYGPHAVARVDGKVHFVRQAAPGDLVELAVREDRGTYSFSEVAALLEPGPARRLPPCPYLPRCGGCPWQHVRYEVQLRAKEELVRELLGRIGGFERPPVGPVVPSAREFEYRRRLSLRVEGRRVGYFAAASHELVPVSECLLGRGPLRRILPLVQEWVSRTKSLVKRVEVYLSDRDEIGFAAEAEGGFAEEDREVSAAFVEKGGNVVGIVGQGRLLAGRARVGYAVPGAGVLEVTLGTFVQVHPEQNERLVSLVLEFAELSGAEEVLEFYAGFGNLSFPLARHAGSVHAVERSRQAVEDARENARRLGVRNVRFSCADAGRFAARHREEISGADVVVLDPPRSGAAELVPSLLEASPRTIVYVSCNPSTLARDLRSLASRYRLVEVRPVDFFPQTYHVEVVARLERE